MSVQIDDTTKSVAVDSTKLSNQDSITFNTITFGGATDRLGFPALTLGAEFGASSELTVRMAFRENGTSGKTKTAQINCARVGVFWIDPTDAPVRNVLVFVAFI